MRALAIVTSLFAAGAVAAPSASNEISVRSTDLVELQNQAKAVMDAKVAAGCKVKKCLIALAPMSVTCAAALAEDGINLLMDAACFAQVLDKLVNPPAACAGCY